MHLYRALSSLPQRGEGGAELHSVIKTADAQRLGVLQSCADWAWSPLVHAGVNHEQP